MVDRLLWNPAGTVNGADRAVTVEGARTPVEQLLARRLLRPAGPDTVLLPREVAWHLRDQRFSVEPVPSTAPSLSGRLRTPAHGRPRRHRGRVRVRARRRAGRPHPADRTAPPAAGGRGGRPRRHRARPGPRHRPRPRLVRARVRGRGGPAGGRGRRPAAADRRLRPLGRTRTRRPLARPGRCLAAHRPSPRVVQRAGGARARTRVGGSRRGQRPRAADRAAGRRTGGHDPGPGATCTTWSAGTAPGSSGSAGSRWSPCSPGPGAKPAGSASTAWARSPAWPVPRSPPTPIPLPAELADAFPATVEQIVLQADLTAVAPGPVPYRLARRAAAAGRPGVPRWRRRVPLQRSVVAPGVRCGLVGRRRPPLAEHHATTAPPQPLAYLIDDIARQHGSIRVGPANAYVRIADPAQVAAILTHPDASVLGLRELAPGVLVAAAEPYEVVDFLHRIGHSPAGEDSSGRSVTAPDPLRAPRRAAHRPRPDVQAGEAAAAVLVGEQNRQSQTRRLSPSVRPRGTAENLERLASAQRDSESVRIRYVAADGRPAERELRAVQAEAGLVRDGRDQRPVRIPCPGLLHRSGVRTSPPGRVCNPWSMAGVQVRACRRPMATLRVGTPGRRGRDTESHRDATSAQRGAIPLGAGSPRSVRLCRTST